MIFFFCYIYQCIYLILFLSSLHPIQHYIVQFVFYVIQNTYSFVLLLLFNQIYTLILVTFLGLRIFELSLF